MSPKQCLIYKNVKKLLNSLVKCETIPMIYARCFLFLQTCPNVLHTSWIDVNNICHPFSTTVSAPRK